MEARSSARRRSAERPACDLSTTDATLVVAEELGADPLHKRVVADRKARLVHRLRVLAGDVAQTIAAVGRRLNTVYADREFLDLKIRAFVDFLVDPIAVARS